MYHGLKVQYHLRYTSDAGESMTVQCPEISEHKPRASEMPDMEVLHKLEIVFSAEIFPLA